MQLSTSIIDNIDQNIWDVIKDNLTKSQQVQFAVGYLFLSGLRDIYDGLQEMDAIQLLIWNRTNHNTSQVLGTMFDKKQEQLQTPHEIDHIKQQTGEEYAHDIGTEFTQNHTDKDFLYGLYELIKSGRLEIKIYTKGTFHAKAYIFTAKPWSIAKWRCLVWSSNLSQSGFYDNTELNVVVDGDGNFDKMQERFLRLREESEEFNTQLIDTMDQSWIKAEPTPYEVYMKVLYELVGHIVDNDGWRNDFEIIKDLYQFQIDAVQQAVQTVHKYGGVFVSDVVWLGKTYTWSAIMNVLTQESWTKWLILCPSKLQEERKHVIGHYGINADVMSIDGLKNIINKKRYDKVQYVLIDESHKFKDPNTQRYPMLQEFIHRTDKKLILLSATPLNLNGRDVYHQIKLFHKWDFTELPIAPNHLYEFFKKYEKWETHLSDVVAELMVRRTRLHIKNQYKKDLERIGVFPDRVWPTPIQYDINTSYHGIYDEIESILGQRMDFLSPKERKEFFAVLSDEEREIYAGSFKYSMYDKVKYIKDEYCELSSNGRKIPIDDEFADIQNIGENLKSLAKIMFYQRLESSPQAFINTVDRIIDYYKLYITNLENGYIFKTKHSSDLEEYREVFDTFDEESEEYFALADKSYTITKFNTQAYLSVLRKDLDILEWLREKSEILIQADDVKFNKLLEIIQRHDNHKILIFSQYSDSTKYLKDMFDRRSYNRSVAELSWNTYKELSNLLWRFSPKSQKNEDKDIKYIDILLATDIIAEWQNLQDAHVIINYDLHRNPVKLIQRIGRIDRIWSTNDKIYIYNFYPSTTWEDKIKMQKKIKERVSAIHQHIGEENKILSPEEELNTKMLLLSERIQSWDESALEETEEITESFQGLFSYSPYIKELNDCRNNSPDLYKKIKKLPFRMRTAQWWNEKLTLVFCKYGEIEQCLIRNPDWSIENNKKKFLKNIACDITTKTEKLPPDHDDLTTFLEEHFIRYTRDYDHSTIFNQDLRQSNDIVAFKNKLQKYADEYVDSYDYELHDKLETVISFLDQWLETRQKKKFKVFKKIKKVEKFTTDIIDQLYLMVQQLESGNMIQEKHRERYIVMSESILN